GVVHVLVDKNTCTTSGTTTIPLKIEQITACPAACGAGTTQLVISIYTDTEPDETGWILQNSATGATIQEVVPGTMTVDNQNYVWIVCVSNTLCYNFTIYNT